MGAHERESAYEFVSVMRRVRKAHARNERYLSRKLARILVIGQSGGD